MGGKNASLSLYLSAFLLQLKKDQPLEADEVTANIQRPSRKSVTKMLCESSVLYFACLLKQRSYIDQVLLGSGSKFS